MSLVGPATVDPGTDLMRRIREDGSEERVSWSTYRGEHARFHPDDAALRATLQTSSLVHDLVGGLAPASPPVEKHSRIVAFGSCFAEHIANHLDAAGYAVLTKRDQLAHIAIMGDGIVNSAAVLAQFEWAWSGWRPQAALWDDSEDVRLATKALLDATDIFVITLGLSEAWHDVKTGEVFWRAIPPEKFDPARHKFRTISYAENVANLNLVAGLIARHRPEASTVFTLSPIPLAATFRPIPCFAANAASKASLRSAIDYLIGPRFGRLTYFPAYEVVLNIFQRPFMEDRRHVHRHVIDFMMTLFAHCYCAGGPDASEVFWAYQTALALDGRVVDRGHWAVPRTNLKWSKPR